MSALELKTAPAVEPITTAEAKSHMRVDIDSDNTLIGNLITAARRHTEAYIQKSLITQTWYQYFDYGFPHIIQLEKNPVQSVTAITYTDGAGSSQTLDSANYTLDGNRKPGIIYEAYGKVWPVTRVIRNAVRVEFVAGYGDASTDVPQDIIQAMQLLVSHLYENREASAPINISEVPMGYKALLDPYALVRW